MSSSSDILDRIDETLGDHDRGYVSWDGRSPDAAQWVDGEWVDTYDPDAHFGEIARRLQVSFAVAFQPFVDAMKHVVRQVARVYSVPLGWLILDETSQPKHCTPAAERTRSAQWRAGTRRTKRLARKRRGA